MWNSIHPYRDEAGNVLFYVFMAVGLMAALTFAYVNGSRDSFSAQNAMRIGEELFVQSNLIRAAVAQCTIEFQQGGGDLAPAPPALPDGVIDANDNPNNPYPLNPSSPLNPRAPAGIAAAPNDEVRYLTCVGAPVGEANIFQSGGNQGRFLPPPPPGLSQWIYKNDANGVYIQINSLQDATAQQALERLLTKFGACQADMNFGGCGPECLTVWVLRRVVCP